MKRKRVDSEKTDRKESIKRIKLALILTLLCCTGCAKAVPEGEDHLIITEKEGEERISYTMTEVSTGDVVLTERIECTYLQVEDQDVSFSVSGRRIARTLVREGDTVVKGQLLAELANDQAGSRIDELEYQIARNSLLLEHVDENENNELSARWLQFLYRSGGTKEEEEALKESIRQLQTNDEYLREDYRDAIELDRIELESLRKSDAESRVYAKMNGTVSWVKNNLEGSTCTRDEIIMKIIDGSECLFVVEGEELGELFAEGVPVEMSISSGTGAGQYQLLPYKMEDWGERLTFSLQGEVDSSSIEVGAAGSMQVVVDRREGVLTLPSRAVHTADGKPYVYVEGEGNTREVKWIETGLHGDESVEITGGLEQGEKVILK
ncbi:MAG: efflux RND transporter periplasmic adaptor subunit [Acetatifactor sp.]|nr:efflux RND transporter periplasmic adaptor subunit [Acetatifactor sp.]MDE7354496.1 efflux RND transporter periplasmic adaptor subunit [Acetatifactor sp.]